MQWLLAPGPTADHFTRKKHGQGANTSQEPILQNVHVSPVFCCLDVMGQRCPSGPPNLSTSSAESIFEPSLQSWSIVTNSTRFLQDFGQVDS